MPRSLRRTTIVSALLAGLSASAFAQAPGDSVELADRAEGLLRAGYPWRATEVLDSALRFPENRSPPILILAARAAAGWNGWSRVESLLAGENWLDSLGGEGHALLARAALARGNVPIAAARARRAFATSPGTIVPERMVLLAQAFDRLELRDSAAMLYRDAAPMLLPVADWLLLRAATLMPDSAERGILLGRVSLATARERVRWAEARARERAGSLLGAARLYDSLGAPVSAFRLRLDAPGADRDQVRRQLTALLGSDPGPVDSRAAIALMDRHFAPLTPAEELVVARRAARIGDHARAAAGYGLADRAGLLTAADRFSFAGALGRLGRYDDAQAQYSRIRDSSLAGRAQYQRARTLMLAGRVDGALGALEAVTRLFPHDTAAAGTALYLTGDLREDRGEDSASRAAFRTLGQRYPGHPFAARARMRAALIAFRRGDHTTAARELDALRRVTPRHQETWAATYWSGRALAALGDSTGAAARWTEALSGPDDYYGVLAARALGRSFWSAPALSAPPPASGAARAAVARITLLERLGLDAEADHEWNALLRRAGTGQEAVALAAHLDSVGFTGRAYRLAVRAGAVDRLGDGAMVRLLYPLPRRDALLVEAERHAVDPLLVAALIRQESAFDPRALSSAGARGLMQMLPSVGAMEARAIGLEGWDPILLYEPDVNLRLGARHLAGALARHEHLEHALAAYNAGGSRVERWLRTPGLHGDAELFVERIPYVETRDYVRRIVVNLERYRALYGDQGVTASATLQ